MNTPDDELRARQLVVRALNQQLCPHCGQPMIASTPARPAEDTPAQDGSDLSKRIAQARTGR